MGRVILAGMVEPRPKGMSVSRVMIGAVVFAFGLLAGAGIAMWAVPPYWMEGRRVRDRRHSIRSRPGSGERMGEAAAKGRVGVATQRCWIYAEAMGPPVTRDAVIALVISIVATAALVSLGVV
jgi:hypothetical protein